mmetsp:Transcript_17865/g.58431  ORF Transcript_17865/g.58431 Transcript_17865/m.58431 type:complete len:200 (+) Transcript_17865:55-654(+)
MIRALSHTHIQLSSRTVLGLRTVSPLSADWCVARIDCRFIISCMSEVCLDFALVGAISEEAVRSAESTWRVLPKYTSLSVPRRRVSMSSMRRPRLTTWPSLVGRSSSTCRVSDPARLKPPPSAPLLLSRYNSTVDVRLYVVFAAPASADLTSNTWIASQYPALSSPFFPSLSPALCTRKHPPNSASSSSHRYTLDTPPS